MLLLLQIRTRPHLGCAWWFCCARTQLFSVDQLHEVWLGAQLRSPLALLEGQVLAQAAALYACKLDLVALSVMCSSDDYLPKLQGMPSIDGNPLCVPRLSSFECEKEWGNGFVRWNISKAVLLTHSSWLQAMSC
jgi:hypothetical protein